MREKDSHIEKKIHRHLYPFSQLCYSFFLSFLPEEQIEQEGNLKENEEAKEQARTERKKKSYLTEKTSSLQQD